MTSQNRIAANRVNGRKSHGPKTPAGKRVSKRNALRHGLSAVYHRPPILRRQAKELADAICGSDQNVALYEQAAIIAEDELLLQAIKSQRIAIIERLRDPYALPLAKGDTRIQVAKAMIGDRDVAYDEFSQLRAKLIKEGKEVFTWFEGRPIKPGEPVYRFEPKKDRDEYEALREGIRDLKQLMRYERRVWSRQKRAITVFAAIKVIQRMQPLQIAEGSPRLG